MALMLALLSAAVYGGSVALQQHEAKATSTELALRPGLLARLARRPVWLVGMAGDIAGFGVQTASLAIGSLVLVQPVVTTNLVFAMVFTALLAGGRLSGRQWRASLRVVVGLIMFFVAAHPSPRSHAVATAAGWWTVVAGIGGLMALAVSMGWSASGLRRAMCFGLAAGAAEGLMAVVAKAFGERLADGLSVTVHSWEPYGVVGCGLVTLLMVQTAYQVDLPMLVLPVLAVVEPLIAVAVGVGLFGERLDLGGVRGLLVIASAGLLGIGLTALSRDPAPHRNDASRRHGDESRAGSGHPRVVG